MGNEWKKRRRHALFVAQDGKCHWCGRACIEAVVSPKKRPPNLATLDHLNDRFHPHRRVPANGEQRLVMACHACNNRRGRESCAAQPLAELRRRSARGQEARA